MRYGEAYVKQTEKQYAAEVRERQEKQLARRAKALGFELKKVEPPVEIETRCRESPVSCRERRGRSRTQTEARRR
jgi:hypothetical protein